MLGCKEKEPTPIPTLSGTMRGIVEDVLWEGGVLTTDEIYRGVWAEHAQLGLLLPPRWKEEVKQILEVHCISHGGDSWFLERLEPLEERPEFETSLFDPHGTSERIINDSNRGQKRTDWANTDSYRYLDLALPEYVAGDTVRNVVLGIFLSRLRQLRRLTKWVHPRGRGPVWRLWQLGQAGREEAGRQGHSTERSSSSIARTSSKMPEIFESALRFDEGIIRAP